MSGVQLNLGLATIWRAGYIWGPVPPWPQCGTASRVGQQVPSTSVPRTSVIIIVVVIMLVVVKET